MSGPCPFQNISLLFTHSSLLYFHSLNRSWIIVEVTFKVYDQTKFDVSKSLKTVFILETGKNHGNQVWQIK